MATETTETLAAPAANPPTLAANPPVASAAPVPAKPVAPRPKRDYQPINDVKTPIWPFVWLAWIVFWFLGALVCLARLLVGHRLVRKLRRSLTAPADERLTRLLQESLAHIGSRRRVRLWESRLAPAPLSFGVLRPMIVLPTALAPSWTTRNCDWS